MQFENITPQLIRAVITNHVRKTQPDFKLPQLDVGDACIAGGAVANAILYLTGGIDHLVINDVDIFVWPGSHGKVAKTLGINLEDHNLKQETIISGYAGQNRKSHIVGTARIGALNIIFSEHHNQQHLFDDFDINCCHAAIALYYFPDWYSKDAVATTEHFEKWLKTKQIEATFAHNAFGTSCRLLNKHRDLGGYLNADLELSILSQMHHTMNKDSEKQTFPLPKKYYGYFEKYPILKKYFIEGPDNTYSTKNQWPDYGLGPWAKIWHYRVALGTQGKFAKRLLHEATRCLTIEDYQADTLTKMLEQTSVGPGVPTHQALRACWNLYGHRGATHLLKMTYDVHKDYEIAAAMKKADDEYPGIYGLMEADWQVQQIISLSGFHAGLQKAVAKYKKENIVLDDEVGVPTMIRSIQVKELTSTMALRLEGRDMKHCVGGYSAQIKNGYSKIFSLTDIKTGERSTLQVRWMRVNKATEPGPIDSNWFIGQHRGKCNCTPSDDLREAANLVAIYMQENVDGPSATNAILVDDDPYEIEIPF